MANAMAKGMANASNRSKQWSKAVSSGRFVCERTQAKRERERESVGQRPHWRDGSNRQDAQDAEDAEVPWTHTQVQ